MHDLSVIIVNYKSEKFLKPCLASLFNQRTQFTYQCTIINNDSSEIQKINHLINTFNQINILHRNNVGFAAGNNIGIRLTKCEFILCINPDIILTSTFLEIMMKKIKENKNTGAICGKLLRYDSVHNSKTNIIDSTGLIIKRNRRVFDRGQNEKDIGQYDTPEEVFGVSAATALYRKEALEDTKVVIPPSRNATEDSRLFNAVGGSEYFDEDFFVYKEDVDLSWRLRLAGWKLLYEPTAIAYHVRGTGALSDKSTPWQIMQNRRKTISVLVKIWSYRNQRLMQIKNEQWQNFLSDFLVIIAREAMTFFYILLIEPFLFKGFFQFLTLLPRTIKKRRVIIKKSRVSWREIRKWFK